jgi:DNA-binding MarR family transcriptional regulator
MHPLWDGPGDRIAAIMPHFSPPGHADPRDRRAPGVAVPQVIARHDAPCPFAGFGVWCTESVHPTPRTGGRCAASGPGRRSGGGVAIADTPNDQQTGKPAPSEVLDSLDEYLTSLTALRRRIRERTDLSDSAWNALLELQLAADQGRTVMPKELAAALDLRSASITALVDKLVRLGYVDRQASPADRRGLTLSITPAGTRFVDENDLARGPESKVADGMPSTDAQLVARVLAELAGAAERSFPSRTPPGRR